MIGIVEIAKQWLAGEKSSPVSPAITQQHIIESLLAEIQRIEAVGIKASEEVQRLKTDGVNEIRLEVAEECAVICETADYVIRSYGCATEIRKKFGIPIHKTLK
jgi:2-polyprenyl-6-methoxyphenol hydroxylase-like FAD-dependent oxidoreductase